jgi:hypothetical protein
MTAESQQAAIRALEEDAGCTNARAAALATALAAAAADEALELTAGLTQVYGSAVDARVARLERLITALPDEEPVPSAYEVGVMFRITVTQARNVLNIYGARFSQRHRMRMARLLRAVEPTAESRDGKKVWKFEFSDPALLDYAVEDLRRRGMNRGVTPNRRAVELYVERDVVDRHGLGVLDVFRRKFE